MKALVVSENTSASFGGAAAAVLPRVLRKLGVAVWLATHARTRAGLSALFPDDPTLLYVKDSVLNRAMWQIGTQGAAAAVELHVRLRVADRDPTRAARADAPRPPARASTSSTSRSRSRRASHR